MYDLASIEALARKKLNDPNPDVQRKAQAALAEVQRQRSPQGMAQAYTQAAGGSDYMKQLGQMAGSSPWAGMKTLEAQKQDADLTGMVNGQKTWARQLDEANAFGQLNGQWTQAGRTNEGSLTGKDPTTGRPTYSANLQDRQDFGVDPLTGKSTLEKISSDRNYNLAVRQENRMSAAANNKAKGIYSLGTPQQVDNYLKMFGIFSGTGKSFQENADYAKKHPGLYYGPRAVYDLGPELYGQMVDDLDAIANGENAMNTTQTKAAAASGQTYNDYVKRGQEMRDRRNYNNTTYSYIPMYTDQDIIDWAMNVTTDDNVAAQLLKDIGITQIPK